MSEFQKTSTNMLKQIQAGTVCGQHWLTSEQNLSVPPSQGLSSVSHDERLDQLQGLATSEELLGHILGMEDTTNVFVVDSRTEDFQHNISAEDEGLGNELWVLLDMNITLRVQVIKLKINIQLVSIVSASWRIYGDQSGYVFSRVETKVGQTT